MASKRRRSETSPQTPVFRFSLDVRFQTDSERKRSSPGLVAYGTSFRQREERKYTTMAYSVSSSEGLQRHGPAQDSLEDII